VIIIIIFATLVVAALFITYYMGKDVGYQYGWDDCDQRVFLCRDCRMSAVRATMDSTHSNSINQKGK
jgi:hypothetical protein